MKKEIDCQVFEDQLDALTEGSLPDEGLGQLQIHALTCPDCAMLLRVQEHLSLPSLAELEASVPEGLLASVWPKVAGVVKEGGTVETPEPFGEETSGPPKSLWLVPTLAAASVALLLSTGFLFSELRQTQAREVQLAERVEEIGRGLAELDERTVAVERTTQLTGQRSWARNLSLSLGSEEFVTIERIMQKVRLLPPGEPLLSETKVEDLLGGVLSRGLRGLPSGIRQGSQGDGFSAGELLDLLESLDLDPGLTVPKDRLIDLLT